MSSHDFFCLLWDLNEWRGFVFIGTIENFPVERGVRIFKFKRLYVMVKKSPDGERHREFVGISKFKRLYICNCYILVGILSINVQVSDGIPTTWIWFIWDVSYLSVNPIFNNGYIFLAILSVFRWYCLRKNTFGFSTNLKIAFPDALRRSTVGISRRKMMRQYFRRK